MPYAVAAAAITAGAGYMENSQNQKNQKNAIAPTQQAQGALYSSAENIAATPYTAYTGQQAAPLSANQQQGIQVAANQGNNGATQDFGAATGQANYIAGNQWNSATAAKYMNPYTQSVTDKALAQEQRNYQGTINNQNANAASTGAFGGDRAALTNAATAGENELAQGTTEAQGQASAYDNAQKAWGEDNSRAASAARTYDAAGNSITSATNSQIGNLGATGATQQMTQQALDSSKYNNYLDQRSWAANQLAPLEAAVGKSVYANPTQTNGATAALGAGAAAIGAYGKSQTPSDPNAGSTAVTFDSSNPGYSGGMDPNASLGAGSNVNIAPTDSSAGYFSSGATIESDRRLKHHIEPLARGANGLRLHRFQYKGRLGTFIGYMADEVQMRFPKAVVWVNGFMHLNYGLIPRPVFYQEA